jgi:hypothetical protein
MLHGGIRDLELWHPDLMNRISGLAVGDTEEKGRKHVPIQKYLVPILEEVPRNRVAVVDTNNVFQPIKLPFGNDRECYASVMISPIRLSTTTGVEK